MKNLLVHYDSPKNLEELVDTALNYCSVFQDSTTISFAYIKEKLEDEKSLVAKLQELVESKKSNNPPIYSFIKKEGKPFIEVVNLAKEISADSIIIVAQSKKGFSMFNDNIPYYTVTQAPCPVITLTNNVKMPKVNTIILPLGSTADTRQKIPVSVAIAKANNAEIHILAFGKDRNDKEARVKIENYGEQSRKYLEGKGVKARLFTQYGKDPIELITSFTKRQNGDLIVITAEEDSGFFGDNLTEKMIETSPFPVLSIQAKDLKVSWAGL